MSSDFSPAERAAVYRVIRSRRDVREQFVGDDVSEVLLARVLEAAHCAPSVGFSQPWRFIVVRELATRTAVYEAFLAANDAASRIYSGARAEHYRALRLQGILSAPVNICVVCEQKPERGNGLGRQTMPETVNYSTVCAIQNLWLAARVEGLGVGWVSIAEPQALRDIFCVPATAGIVAYLCLGFVSAFRDEPDLQRADWERRLPLEDVIHRERYGAK
ncbi:MAG: 5,6-dimethylbenzimidazole synthase [Vulcanimicrobiaceae bacterium]